MEGKRYLSTLFPSYSIGGIIQFVDGYWPPIGQPPCADPGLCAYVENTELYGLYITDCAEKHLLTQEEVVRDNATLIAKAEEAMARMRASGTLPPAEPQPPPAPVIPTEWEPSVAEIKAMNKKQLLQFGENLDIADHEFREGTRADRIKSILDKMQE